MKNCYTRSLKKILALSPITAFFKFLVLCYRRTLSPLLGPRCRFYPSCSSYALLCLEKHYWPKALAKITLRLFKCNPFHPGGEDLP